MAFVALRLGTDGAGTTDGAARPTSAMPSPKSCFFAKDFVRIAPTHHKRAVALGRRRNG
jgi:hypothetical protein